MPSTELVELTRERILEFALLEADQEGVPPDSPLRRKRYGDIMGRWEQSVISRAAVNNGVVIGVGGLHLIAKGVGQAWVHLIPKVGEHRGGLTVAMQGMIGECMGRLALHRFQILETEPTEATREWYAKMGVMFEGVLRQAGPRRSDLYMYSVVRQLEDEHG